MRVCCLWEIGGTGSETSGAGEVRAGEVRAGQLRPGEVRVVEVRAREGDVVVTRQDGPFLPKRNHCEKRVRNQEEAGLVVKGDRSCP
jgi:hypothetical protein